MFQSFHHDDTGRPALDLRAAAARTRPDLTALPALNEEERQIARARGSHPLRSRESREHTRERGGEAGSDPTRRRRGLTPRDHGLHGREGAGAERARGREEGARV